MAGSEFHQGHLDAVALESPHRLEEPLDAVEQWGDRDSEQVDLAFLVLSEEVDLLDLGGVAAPGLPAKWLYADRPLLDRGAVDLGAGVAQDAAVAALLAASQDAAVAGDQDAAAPSVANSDVEAAVAAGLDAVAVADADQGVAAAGDRDAGAVELLYQGAVAVGQQDDEVADLDALVAVAVVEDAVETALYRCSMKWALCPYTNLRLLFNPYGLINEYCLSDCKRLICLPILVLQLHGIGISQQGSRC